MNLYHLIGAVLLSSALGALLGGLVGDVRSPYQKFNWLGFTITTIIGGFMGLGIYLLLV